ncbi:hypothetical protein V5O48_003452 [Marasmius crinis-equi]|uniref:Fungal N-terminal domain-containing protein n=1 Tax=Marasmius crinis-equi TaxID=585013 RepID=A0ABR3FSV4_9AGAR
MATFPDREKLQKNSTVFLAAASGTSVIVLKALKSVADWAPVPYLSGIASIALGILETVQSCKSNKEDFNDLGRDACELVYAIHTTRTDLERDGGALSTDLQRDLGQLLDFLKEVQIFVYTKGMRSVVSRLFAALTKSDAEEIAHFRQRLAHYLDIFQLQADITIRQLVSRLASRDKVKADLVRPTTEDGRRARSVQIPQSSYSSSLIIYPPSNSGSSAENIGVGNNISGGHQTVISQAGRNNTNVNNYGSHMHIHVSTNFEQLLARAVAETMVKQDTRPLARSNSTTDLIRDCFITRDIAVSA